MADDIERVACLEDSRLPIVRSFFSEDCAIDFRSLGDLVHQVSLALKDDSIRLVGNSIARAAVQMACHEFDEQSDFGRLRDRQGFHQILLQAIRDLRHTGYDQSHLEACSDPKLAALARVWTLVESEFDELPVTFATTLMQRQIGRDDVDLATLGHIVFVQGSTRHPLAAKWLNWVASCGARVTVIVEGLGKESKLFAATREIEADYGVQALSQVEPHSWYQCMFTQELLRFPAPKVEIHSACDRLTETEWVIRHCMREVTAGTEQSKIVIICRDIEDYGILLQFAAQRHGLSLRSTVSQPLGRNAFVALMINLMKALAGNDVRALRESIRSTFFGFSSSTIQSLFDALLQSYRLPAEQWLILEETASAIEGATPLLDILAWRKAVITQPAGLVEWLHRFQQLISTEPFPDRFSGEQNPTRERDLRAFRALERELAASASLTQSRKDQHWSLGEFARWCEVIGKNSETVVTVGDRHGVQVVGSPDSARDCEVAFVIGVLEGKWPKRRSDHALLFDEDRAELHRIFPDLPRIPDSHDEARAERDQFVKLCAIASRRLVLSYPLADGDKVGKPAFYLNELRRIFGTQIEQPAKLRKHIIPPDEECVSLADRMVRNALNGERAPTPPVEIHSEKSRELLRPDWDRGIRLRHLATAAECPFHAAFQYQLRVVAPDDYNRLSTLLSIPRRASLATQPTPETARAAMEHELNEILAEQFSKREYWAWKLLDSAGQRLIRDWINREFAQRENWPIDISNTFTNVELGDEGTKDRAKLGGKVIHLRDTVDAVSKIGPMSVVTSYRTSSPRTQSARDLRFQSKRDRIQIGLLSMACRRGGQTMGFLVDSIGGERELFVCISSPDDIQELSNLKIKFKRMSEAEDFGRVALEEAEIAVDAMDRGLVRPVPGDYCEHCAFGELCRRSMEFGEASDWFDEVVD